MTKMIETGDTGVDETLTILNESIEGGDVELTTEILEDLLQEALSNQYLAKWITEPANITKLHEDLVEHLGVHPRTMQLKDRIPHRQRRAVFFLKAMVNGVKRVK